MITESSLSVHGFHMRTYVPCDAAPVSERCDARIYRAAGGGVTPVILAGFRQVGYSRYASGNEWCLRNEGAGLASNQPLPGSFPLIRVAAQYNAVALQDQCHAHNTVRPA
jgi:hypothetical protein